MFFFGPFFGILPLIFIILIIRGMTSMMRHRGGFFPGYEFDHQLEDMERGGRDRGLRIQIFKLAYRRKGRITVSDIIAETGMSGEEAEEAVQSMVDNSRVRMEVRDDGVVVYEFPEILSQFEG